MPTLPVASSLAVFGLFLAGCCCDPCARRCDPCAAPAATPAAVPMPMPTPTPAPKPGAPTAAASGAIEFHVEGGGIVVAGPDGKPLQLQVVTEGQGGARVVSKDGQTVVIISEGKEDEKGEAHEGMVVAGGGAVVVADAPDRGYVGFAPVPVAALPAEAKAKLKITADKGLVAVNVRKGAPAEQAGLRDGDVILKYAGQDVSSVAGEVAGFEAFVKAASAVKAGATVEIVVERDGKPVTLTAKAIDRAAIQKFAPDDDDDDEADEKGEKDEQGEHEGAKGEPTKEPAPAK